jgi:hypothetical protein
LGHKPAVPHVSKNSIPSVFKGQNIRVLGLLKYGKTKALGFFETLGTAYPLKQSHVPERKAIRQVDMLENTFSNAAEICVMCRDDGSFHADVNAKFH